jgi:alanyl-tRNA synthetase
MGNFYTNYTLRGPTQEQVAAALEGRSAFVTPQQNGCVVVYDEESEDQDMEVLSQMASRLSEELRCPVLAVLNHDDDILWYQLYADGELIDDYNSSPDYFEEVEESTGPSGGDAEGLCRAFGSRKVAEVKRILQEPFGDKYTFAVQRHEDLARALGIPLFAVGKGYSYIARG